MSEGEIILTTMTLFIYLATSFSGDYLTGQMLPNYRGSEVPMVSPSLTHMEGLLFTYLASSFLVEQIFPTR